MSACPASFARASASPAPAPASSRHKLNRPKLNPLIAPFDNADGQADCVIEGKDGSAFAVHSTPIGQHSAKLSNKLSAAMPAGAAKRESGRDLIGSREHLPVVDLGAWDEQTLAFFLRNVVPKKYLGNDGKPPQLAAYDQGGGTVLENVLRLCKRYECSQVSDTLIRIHLAAYAATAPLALDAWALAARYGQSDQARIAIQTLALPGHAKASAGAQRWDANTRKVVKNEREPDISDLDITRLEGVPLSSIHSFCAVRAKVAASTRGKYTWRNAAEEFKLW